MNIKWSVKGSEAKNKQRYYQGAGERMSQNIRLGIIVAKPFIIMTTHKLHWGFRICTLVVMSVVISDY